MKFDKILAERIIKTVYLDGDRVVKVFNSGYTKADILNEALNQARLEEAKGINVPKILQVTTFDGKWAIVYQHVTGKTLAQMMEENPQNKEEYLTLFVDLQMKVHGAECALLYRHNEVMSHNIARANLPATVRYDLLNRLESMPKTKQVCHGDFNPSNVVITADGSPFIIDWALATQGNALADVARTYLLFLLGNEETDGERYLEIFCAKSGVEKSEVKRWIPIVAAAQSVKSSGEKKEFFLKKAECEE